MSVWSEIEDEIKAIVKKVAKDETLATAEELEKLTHYIGSKANHDQAYAIAYKIASSEERLKYRDITNEVMKAAADKAKARKAARNAAILEILSFLFQSLATALIAEIEKI